MPFRIIRNISELLPAQEKETMQKTIYFAPAAKSEEEYDSNLNEAKEKGFAKVAFVQDEEHRADVKTAVNSFTRFLENNEMDIIYVENGLGMLPKEYRNDLLEERKKRFLLSPFGSALPAGMASSENSVEGVADKISFEDVSERSMLKSVPAKKSAAHGRRILKRKSVSEACAESASESLEESLKKIYTDSFEKQLQKLINKKGLKNSEVYTAANISKQYFSKLLNGKVKPSKEKMLALAVGLRLNYDETVDFLKIAGYAFSPISQTDTVVAYFINRKEYNVMLIDVALFEFGLEPISNNG